MKIGAAIFGGLSALLLIFLLVGFLLPGTWEAEADIILPESPVSIFPLLDSPEAWEEWFPMPEAGVEHFGNPRGAGAGIRWDDPQYGKGEMRITLSSPDSLIGYEVEIEGGSLVVRGELALSPVPGGTRVFWKEEGDFGRSPLMGYAARGMAGSQGEALKESLEALRRLVSGLP